jgi:3-deoxy-D-manno-octulosonate 8-phosphate phosphatase (KDO 8-P phosphatase)
MHLTPDNRANLRRIRLLVFDFDGVFTDNAVWVREDGIEIVRCSREDGMGIGLVRDAGLGPEMIVLSTEENPVVTARCRKLKLRAVQGVHDKAYKLDLLAAEFGMTLSDIGYVGNDINDRECLLRVGLPIVVADSHFSVLELGKLRTEKNGGHGAVREICDALLECRSGSL